MSHVRRRPLIAAGLVPAAALALGLAAPAAAAVAVLEDFEGLDSGSLGAAGFYTYNGGAAGAGFGVETVAPGEAFARPDQTEPNNILSVGADVPSDYAGFGQNFASVQDASAFDGLQVWMYGTGTGAVL